ncbi:MAG: type 1 glutamine amidotransferase domain-containing protein [Verrucomicrobiota bacterium]
MQNTVLALVGDDYEDLELWYPKIRLEEAGFGMHLAAAEKRTCHGKYGYPAEPDVLISKVRTMDYCGLLIPGGWMPDKLRREPKVLDIVREFHETKRVIGFICHGGWIPISARILKGKKATGSHGIKDDLINAGAQWVDASVVVDGHLVSSRTPRDLAPFAFEMVKLLKRQ